MYMIEIVFLVILGGIVSLFGVVSNAVNLAIFWRQGFQDSITVGLTGLAISDMCTVVSGTVISFCFNPLIPFSDMNVDIRELQYLVGSNPRLCFARTTIVITVYIALERCLCVAVPLHVKRILKPQRTLAIVFAIFVLNLLIQLPVYLAQGIGWEFSTKYNKSLIGLIPRINAVQLENLNRIIGVCVQFSFFVILIFLTATLVFMLKKRSQWRAKSATGVSEKNNVSRKDQSAIRLTIMVAAILICLTLPAALLLITRFLEPEFNLGRHYRNLFFSSWSVVSFCEVCNSSVNIFVYYNMNSRYREMFQSLFCRRYLNKSGTGTKSIERQQKQTSDKNAGHD